MSDNIDRYIKLTGQTEQDVMGGAATYGPNFIIDELIPKAIAEKKKIVWVPDLKDGQDLGFVKYELQDI